jgi:hypothetical protein
VALILPWVDGRWLGMQSAGPCSQLEMSDDLAVAAIQRGEPLVGCRGVVASVA